MLSQYLEPQGLFTLRMGNKDWSKVSQEKLNKLEESGEIIIHNGMDKLDQVKKEEIMMRKKVVEAFFHPNITRIGANAFSHTSVVNVTIPEGVTHVGKYAFEG